MKKKIKAYILVTEDYCHHLIFLEAMLVEAALHKLLLNLNF